jgi:hypothetical protein
VEETHDRIIFDLLTASNGAEKLRVSVCCCVLGCDVVTF